MNDWVVSGMHAGAADAESGGTAAAQPSRAARASAKEILESGRVLDAKIAALLTEISGLNDLRYVLSGEDEKRRERLDALREEALSQIEVLKARRKALAKLIERVENADVRSVLALRCLTYKSWLQIGMMLNMDESTARRKYKQGAELLDAALQAGIVEWE